MGAAYEENESIWRRQVLTVLRDIRDAVSPKGETPAPEPEPEKPREFWLSLHPDEQYFCSVGSCGIPNSRHIRVHDADACDRLPDKARLAKLESAIQWALGCGDDFPTRQDGEGAYWWRKELRERSKS